MAGNNNIASRSNQYFLDKSYFSRKFSPTQPNYRSPSGAVWTRVQNLGLPFGLDGIPGNVEGTIANMMIMFDY